MRLVLCFSVLVLQIAKIQLLNEECRLKDGKIGKCYFLPDCKNFLVQTGNQNLEHCSESNDRQSIICCPQAKSEISK